MSSFSLQRYFGVQPGATRSLLINLAQTVSFNLQLGLAVDRYWAVCHPMSYFTNKDSGYRNMIILACVGYSVFEFTVVVCFEFMQMSKLESAFRTFSTVVFASSIVAIIVLYLLMRESLTKQVSVLTQPIILKNLTRKWNVPQGQLRRFMSETSNMPTQAQLKQINDEAELAKTMLLIVASCLICWVPPLVLSAFTAELRPRMDTTTDLKDFRFCLFVVKMEWIGFFINATINPMIYAYRMKEVRSSIANLIVCCPKGPVKVMNCDVTKDNKAFKRDNTNNTKSTTFGTSPSSPSIPWSSTVAN